MLGGASRLDPLPMPEQRKDVTATAGGAQLFGGSTASFHQPAMPLTGAAATMARRLRSSRDGNDRPFAAFWDWPIAWQLTSLARDRRNRRPHNLLMKRQILMG
jgi:hypothetical protein